MASFHDLTNGELELRAGNDRRSVVILTVLNGMSTSPLGKSPYGTCDMMPKAMTNWMATPSDDISDQTDFVDLRIRAQLRWGRVTDPGYHCSAR